MTLARAMTEAQLQDAIIAAARLRGWMVAHFRPARTDKGWRTPLQGDAGYPDLCLARSGRVLFLELKSAKGKVSPEQKRWLDNLAPTVIAEVIRPDDLNTVLRWLE